MRQNIFAFLFFSLLFVVSCQSEKPVNPPSMEPVEVRLSTTAGPFAPVFSQQDRLGVFMTSQEQVSESTILGGVDNVAYRVDVGDSSGASLLALVADRVVFLPDNGSSVVFTAYYPYSSLTDYGFDVDLSDQSNPDMLEIKSAKVKGVNVLNPSVVFNFRQVMSKLKIDLSDQLYTQSDREGATVKITGLNTRGRFDVSSGQLSGISTLGDIPTKSVTEGSSYQAILFPHNTESGITPGKVNIELSIAGRTIIYPFPFDKLEAGKLYSYMLVPTDSQIENTNTTITDWIDDGGVNNGVAQ